MIAAYNRQGTADPSWTPDSSRLVFRIADLFPLTGAATNVVQSVDTSAALDTVTATVSFHRLADEGVGISAVTGYRLYRV